MVEIRNYTPHPITFIDKNNNIIEVIKSSGLARVSSETVVTSEINGIPVTSTVYGEIEGLPEEQDGVIYVVSNLVAQRCAHRNDVFIPNELVRGEEGVIVGCRSLGKVDDPIIGREIWVSCGIYNDYWAYANAAFTRKEDCEAYNKGYAMECDSVVIKK